MYLLVRYWSSADVQAGKSIHIEQIASLMGSLKVTSGKSTLILTLLRLLELQSGTIELDGVDIKQVKLDLLRQRCFITVSQDPLLLPNETLRFNLDPDGAVKDDAVIDALAATNLWSHFCEGNRPYDEGATITDNSEGSDKHSILYRKLSFFQELSVGQCQLFSLCRALAKASFLRSAELKPVVILDEVTSSLDVETESTVYEIIDREFTQKGHTVIIVAHKLAGLEKYMQVGRDAVAVIAEGRLREVIQDIRPGTFQILGQE